ncbi:MAG: hypothetical protein ACK473_03100 [Sphingomonadales bacterium]
MSKTLAIVSMEKSSVQRPDFGNSDHAQGTLERLPRALIDQPSRWFSGV